MDENQHSILARNIRALYDHARQREDEAPTQERIAASITRFTGSMHFVYLHAIILVIWVAANLGLVPALAPFDPDFILLATAASVEAIFLSTFVLISQNRATVDADRRADLDLHVNLLSEHEITHILKLVVAIAERHGIQEAQDPQLDELSNEIKPVDVLDRLSSETGEDAVIPNTDATPGVPK